MSFPIARTCTVLMAAMLIGAGIPGPVASAAATAPTVTSLAPARGANSNRPLVAISGRGFTSDATVRFGSAAATEVQVVSPRLIYARPPSHSDLGAVHVLVRTGAGTSPISAADRYSTVRPPASPNHVRSLGIGMPQQVACPTSSFCMVLGHDGRAVTLHGTAPGRLLNLPLDDPALGVSCSSPTFCAAVSAHQATTFNGTSWAPATTMPLELRVEFPDPLLSCSGPGFCAAVGEDGTWWRYDGTAWVSSADGPLLADDPGSSTDWAVSCVSATFCMAEGEGLELTSSDPDEYFLHGGVFRFDGVDWTRLITYGDHTEGGTNVGMSCASTTYCMALEMGRPYTYDGTQWTARSGSPAHGYLECFAVDRCLAWDVFVQDADFAMHHLYRFDGDTWSNLGVVPANSRTIIDCSTIDDCVAVSTSGTQRRWSDATGWSAAHALGDWLRNAVAVSCVAGPQCVMANAQGQTSTWNGTTWTAPVDADSAAHPTSVSCSAATWCVLVDDGGNALTYDGSAWSAPANIDSRPLTSVSCARSTFCVAVDDGGYAVRYARGTWHAPTRALSSGGLRGVSCPTTTFCMAVGDGEATRYRANGTWTAAESIGPFARSVSCTARTFCMVRTSDATVRIWGGQAFSPPIRLFGLSTSSNDPSYLSCVAPQFCAATVRLPQTFDATLFDGAAYTMLGQSAGDLLKHDATWGPVSCWAPGRCVLVAAGSDAVEFR